MFGVGLVKNGDRLWQSLTEKF